MAAVFKNIGGASALPAHWAATPLKMIFNRDMFGSSMKQLILGHADGRLIILINHHR